MTDEAIARELEESIRRIERDLPGRLGLVVRFLDADLEIRRHAESPFTAASVIKVGIMVEVYRQAERGSLQLDETTVLTAEDMTGGSGVLQYLHPGLPLTVADAVELMISISDNTATNMVLRRVGIDAVNETMRALGLSRTVSAGLLGRARPPEDRHRLSTTSPHDMAVLLTSIARMECVDADASAAMMHHLEHVTHTDVLPRYLPLTPYPARLGYPIESVQIAHKSGSLTGIRHDVGIMTVTTASGTHRAIVSALLDGLEDHDLWTPENVGEVALAELGRCVFEALVRTIPR